MDYGKEIIRMVEAADCGSFVEFLQEGSLPEYKVELCAFLVGLFEGHRYKELLDIENKRHGFIEGNEETEVKISKGIIHLSNGDWAVTFRKKKEGMSGVSIFLPREDVPRQCDYVSLEWDSESDGIEISSSDEALLCSESEFMEKLKIQLNQMMELVTA